MTPLLRIKAWLHWRKLEGKDDISLPKDLEIVLKDYESMRECLMGYSKGPLSRYAIECLAQLEGSGE